MQNSHLKRRNDRENDSNESPWATLLKFAGIGMALGVAAIAGYSVYKVLTAEEVEKLPVQLVQRNDEGIECAICLEYFRLDDRIKVLNECKHKYHAGCINTWIRQNSSCPMCRRSI